MAVPLGQRPAPVFQPVLLGTRRRGGDRSQVVGVAVGGQAQRPAVSASLNLQPGRAEVHAQLLLGVLGLVAVGAEGQVVAGSVAAYGLGDVKLGLDGSRITVGGTGLQPETYPWQDRSAARLRLDLPLDAFVILFLGRKSAYKGLDLTLEAFQA